MSRVPVTLLTAILLGVSVLTPEAIAQRAPPARTSEALPRTTPMQVVLARLASPTCEPACPEWIAMQGDIDEQTLPQVRRMLEVIGPRKVPIVIDSPGGVVNDSFTIGRLIRAKGLDVIVGKTLFKPCADSDSQCRKIKPTAAHQAIPATSPGRCASSCAFILAAGARRFVGQQAFVGVHQIRTVRTEVLRRYRVWTREQSGVPVVTKRELVSEKQLGERVVNTKLSDRVYDRISKYFAEMGIGAKVTVLLKATPPTEIHWISRQDLIETAMATDQADGPTVLLALAKPAVTAPAAASAAPAVTVPAVPALGQQQVIVVAIQQRLKAAGCYKGDADGVWGASSNAALAAFATKAALAVPGGLPDQAVLDALRARSDVTCELVAKVEVKPVTKTRATPRPQTVKRKPAADEGGDPSEFPETSRR